MLAQLTHPPPSLLGLKRELILCVLPCFSFVLCFGSSLRSAGYVRRDALARFESHPQRHQGERRFRRRVFLLQQSRDNTHVVSVLDYLTCTIARIDFYSSPPSRKNVFLSSTEGVRAVSVGPGSLRTPGRLFSIAKATSRALDIWLRLQPACGLASGLAPKFSSGT